MTAAELAKLAAETQAQAQLKSLELLFEYTIFHIGVYLTLTASYIAIATVEINNKVLFKLHPIGLWFAVAAFMVAGLAGGVIASSITQCQCTSSQEFLGQAIGIWDWERLHFAARKWTYIEHTAFWLGLISAVISFAARERGR